MTSPNEHVEHDRWLEQFPDPPLTPDLRDRLGTAIRSELRRVEPQLEPATALEIKTAVRAELRHQKRTRWLQYVPAGLATAAAIALICGYTLMRSDPSPDDRRAPHAQLDDLDDELLEFAALDSHELDALEADLAFLERRNVGQRSPLSRTPTDDDVVIEYFDDLLVPAALNGPTAAEGS